MICELITWILGLWYFCLGALVGYTIGRTNREIENATRDSTNKDLSDSSGGFMGKK